MDIVGRRKNNAMEGSTINVKCAEVVYDAGLFE